MKTTYTVLYPSGQQTKHEVDWPAQPGYTLIANLVEPLVEGHLERVNVFHDDKYTDMFVNETGAIQSPVLPPNEAATNIYRNNVLTHQKPAPDPESLPFVCGVAVLFDRKVWN